MRRELEQDKKWMTVGDTNVKEDKLVIKVRNN